MTSEITPHSCAVSAPILWASVIGIVKLWSSGNTKPVFWPGFVAVTNKFSYKCIIWHGTKFLGYVWQLSNRGNWMKSVLGIPHMACTGDRGLQKHQHKMLQTPDETNSSPAHNSLGCITVVVEWFIGAILKRRPLFVESNTYPNLCDLSWHEGLLNDQTIFLVAVRCSNYTII
jgi:hypothetical protein